METVRHDGRKTAYRLTGEDGDGPTFCYVHGSGGSHRVWVHQYGTDGPSHPAVAVDLSGHGESEDVDTPPGEATLDAYAADVATVSREADADVLVGNSLGGAVVQWVVLETDFDPAGIVLAGSGAKLAVHEDIRSMLAEDFEAAIEFLHDGSRLFDTPTADVLADSKAEMQSAGRAVTERDFLTCHEFDVRDRMDEFGVPALAIVGEGDELTPVSYHEYFRDHLPDCRLAVIEGAAHLAMLEQSAAFNDSLAEFVESL